MRCESSNCSIYVWIGDKENKQGEKESGMYRVNLEDGDNTVSFVVTDETGNAAEFSKDIYVDTVPPQLSIRRYKWKSSNRRKYLFERIYRGRCCSYIKRRTG